MNRPQPYLLCKEIVIGWKVKVSSFINVIGDLIFYTNCLLGYWWSCQIKPHFIHFLSFLGNWPICHFLFFPINILLSISVFFLCIWLPVSIPLLWCLAYLLWICHLLLKPDRVCVLDCITFPKQLHLRSCKLLHICTILLGTRWCVLPCLSAMEPKFIVRTV